MYDVDSLVEADRAREWERINEPDPFEKQMKSASKEILEASSFVSIAEDRITEAYYELEGSPMQKTVEDYLEKLSDMRCELISLSEKYERGERE